MGLSETDIGAANCDSLVCCEFVFQCFVVFPRDYCPAAVSMLAVLVGSTFERLV